MLTRINPAEYARQTGVSHRTVMRRIEKGLIKGARFKNNRWTIPAIAKSDSTHRALAKQEASNKGIKAIPKPLFDRGQVVYYLGHEFVIKNLYLFVNNNKGFYYSYALAYDNEPLLKDENGELKFFREEELQTKPY
jgi:hypothetical protein